jgi:hypothetical protein
MQRQGTECEKSLQNTYLIKMCYSNVLFKIYKWFLKAHVFLFEHQGEKL